MIAKSTIDAASILHHDEGDMGVIKNKLYQAIFLAGAGLIIQTPVTAQEIACRAPEPVCAARDAVFVISSFDPVASAVRISPDMLITNRHVTADQSAVMVTSKSGAKIPGRVIATRYAGDLVLIRVENLGDGPVLPMANANENAVLYTVGTDFSHRKIRVYPPGKVILLATKSAPFGRLHHTALSQPGNSGGALVDETGQLVGIVTSGGEGRFEAFPINAVERLKALSGDSHQRISREIGAAIRACIDFQDTLPRRGRISKSVAQELNNVCSKSNNRQLMDSAAVVLGRSRHLKLSRQLLEQALKRDPQAINTRLSLITTLTFMRQHEDALPHIRKLMKVIPEDGSLQRFAIQAGKFGNDMALANEGLALVQKYNPAQAEAAARFLDAPLRQPKTKSN